MRKTLLAAILTVFSVLALQQAKATIFPISVGYQNTNTFNPTPITIYQGDTLMFNWVSGTHNVTGLAATIPAGATPLQSGNMSAPSGMYMYKATVLGTYTYNCTLHPGMTGSFTVIACVAPTTPTITMNPANGTVCAGQTVTLSIPQQSNVNYQWYLNNVALGTGTSDQIVTPNAGVYKVTVTNNCGSATSAQTATVIINPLPQANFTYTNSAAAYTFTPANVPTATHSWNFGDGSSPSTQASPIHTYTANGTYTVTHKASANGCDSTASKTITVTGVPNGVTTIAGKETFSISPNPASSLLEVRGTATATLSLTDYTGRLVAELAPAVKNGGSMYFDVTKVPAGVYLLQIRTASGSAIGKVQIIH